MAEVERLAEAQLYVASRQGILGIQCGVGEPEVYPFALHGRFVRCLLADAKGVLVAAGTRGRGVSWTVDGGRTWREAAGVAAPEVRALASSGGRLYAGTSPAGLHVSEDGGSSFRRLEGLEGPWTGGWAAPGTAGTEDEPRVADLLARPSELLVAVNSGGVLRSLDGGHTFRDVTHDLPPSVLALAAPSPDGAVFA